MIDFELTDDHKALVQTVKEFGQKEVAPFIKNGMKNNSTSQAF